MAKEKDDKDRRHFDPQKEITSFSREFNNLRVQILRTVNDMKKNVSTGIMDTKVIKTMLDKMNDMADDQARKFGTKQQKIAQQLAKIIRDTTQKQIIEIQKESTQKMLPELKKQLLDTLDATRIKVGTSLFDEKLLKSTFDKMTLISNKMQEAVEKAKQEGILKGKSLKNAKDILNDSKQMIDIKKQELQSYLLINNQLIAAKEAFSDMINTAFSFIEKIPGGKYFSKALELDKIKEQINKNIGKALVSNLGKGIDTAGAFKVAIGGIAQTYLKFARMLLINPWTIAITGIVLLIKEFVRLQSLAEDFRKVTGLTIDQTKKLTPELEDAALSARKYGITIEDIYGSAAEIYKQFQNISFVTADLAQIISTLEKNLGMSKETSVGFAKQLLEMDGVTEKNLKNWIATTAQLAIASYIAPVDVFNDIAESSELIGKYFRGNTKEVIMTAINVRKLGISLKDVGGILDSVMDFESSIEKELEASILLGKSVNFNRVRQLVFNNKIGEATQEIFKQIGSLEEFNKLNYIQKQALADVTGLSVSKIQESLKMRQRVAELDRAGLLTESDKLMLKLEAGELTDQEWLNQQRIQAETTNIKNNLMAVATSLGRVILPIFEALMPAVKSIATFIGSISDGINSIINSFKGKKGEDTFLSNATKQLASFGLLAGIVARKPLFNLLKRRIGGLFGGFGKTSSKDLGFGIPDKLKTEGPGKFNRGMSSFVDIFKKIDMKSILKFAAISAILIGALIGLAFAFKQFEGVDWENVGMAGAALGGLTIVAGIMSKMPTDKILIGSLAIALLGTSLIPFAYSMKLMENVSWTTLGVAATSLIAFSLAAFGLGTLMFTGVGALLFGAGILSIIALGGAMAIFGAGTKIAGESLSNSFIDKIERLANSGTKLIAASVGILALSGAISVFSLSMTGSNVLDRFAGIFGGSSAIDNIERLANSSAQLMQSANALKSIEVSIKGIADVKGLENIAEGIKIYNESESINEGIDKVNKKLDDVIKAINENKNIYIDGRKINESIARSTQLNKLS